MARRSISIVVAAAAWFALAGVANAAGLGRLTVLSPLGQPLLAEIEIVSLQPGEEEGLSARLASPEAFEQAGIDINPALNSLRINLERREEGAYSVIEIIKAFKVTNDPFVGSQRAGSQRLRGGLVNLEQAPVTQRALG